MIWSKEGAISLDWQNITIAIKIYFVIFLMFSFVNYVFFCEIYCTLYKSSQDGLLSLVVGEIFSNQVDTMH